MVGEDLQLIWLSKSSQLCLYYRNFQFCFVLFCFVFWIGVAIWAKSGYWELNLYFLSPVLGYSYSSYIWLWNYKSNIHIISFCGCKR